MLPCVGRAYRELVRAGAPVLRRHEGTLLPSHAGPVAPYRGRMDTPADADAEPDPSVLATIRILARAVERARQAQAIPSSWVLCPPYPQQMDEIRTAPFPGDDHGPATLADFMAMAARVEALRRPPVETPTADGGMTITFPDPEDERQAGGGTLVLTAETLRHFALHEPTFPWETFPEV